MEDMVEPDRTILIVSIIGLVIIWGSVLYHKLVQGGGSGGDGPEKAGTDAVAEPGGAESRPRKKGGQKG